MRDPAYAAFSALDPFFDIVRQGLAGLVDGDHYFDTIAPDAVFEFRYRFPGYPTKIVGREGLMAHPGELPEEQFARRALRSGRRAGHAILLRDLLDPPGAHLLQPGVISPPTPAGRSIASTWSIRKRKSARGTAS
jgi:hypothetical protein